MTSSSRRAIAAMLGLLVLATSVPLPAATSDDEARALVQKGNALRRQNRDLEALPLFERAFALRPTGANQALLGLCEKAAGRFVEAEEHLRAALGSGDAWVASQRAVLEQNLRQVAARLATLEVVGLPPGASIKINGAAVRSRAGSAVVNMRVVAGTVVLEIRADGYAPFRRSLEVAAGSLARERADLVKVDPVVPPSAAVATSPEDVSTHRTRRILAWTTGGAALAMVAIGGAGLGLRNARARAHRDCVNERMALEPCQDLLDSGERFSRLAIGSFVAAGALAVTSVVLFVWPAKKPAKHARWSCTPGIGRGLTLDCQARF